MKPVMHLRGSMHAKMYRRPVVNCSMTFFRNCWLQDNDRIIITTINLSIDRGSSTEEGPPHLDGGILSKSSIITRRYLARKNFSSGGEAKSLIVFHSAVRSVT